jgi:hypothetical protein
MVALKAQGTDQLVIHDEGMNLVVSSEVQSTMTTEQMAMRRAVPVDPVRYQLTDAEKAKLVRELIEDNDIKLPGSLLFPKDPTKFDNPTTAELGELYPFLPESYPDVGSDELLRFRHFGNVRTKKTVLNQFYPMVRFIVSYW